MGIVAEGEEQEFWLDARVFKRELVEELAKFMAYCGAVRGNKETTVAEKIVAVNFPMSSGWVFPYR